MMTEMAVDAKYVGRSGIYTGSTVEYNALSTQSSTGSYIALYVSITICVIAGIVLGIIFGKKAANK